LELETNDKSGKGGHVAFGFCLSFDGLSRFLARWLLLGSSWAWLVSGAAAAHNALHVARDDWAQKRRKCVSNNWLVEARNHGFHHARSAVFQMLQFEQL
jgi:hypothetical protein